MEGSAGTPFFYVDWGSGQGVGARPICTQVRGRRCGKYSCHVPHQTSWRYKASVVLDNAVIFSASPWGTELGLGSQPVVPRFPLTMPNPWIAKLPCEFLCIQLLKVVWDKTYRIEVSPADVVTTFLDLNPLAKWWQKSNMPFFLLPVWPVWHSRFPSISVQRPPLLIFQHVQYNPCKNIFPSQAECMCETDH